MIRTSVRKELMGEVLMKAFFTAQFSYFPLIWMFYSRKLNNKINKLYECCLRIVYSDNTSSFEELFETDNSVSVHHRNTQVLATGLYKIVNGFSPEIMKEIVYPMRIRLMIQEIKESFIRGL